MASNSEKLNVFIARPDLPNSALELLQPYELDIWEKEDFIPRECFLSRIAGKHALYIDVHQKINAEALNAAGKNLKVIGTLSAGLDHIDVDEVKKRGIKLGNVSNVLSESVAECAIGLLLACTRRFYESSKQIVEGKWPAWYRWNWMNGHLLRNSVIGIFGAGNIGSEIAIRLASFKPSKILYTCRTKKTGIPGEKVSLEELLQQSDAVILAVSLNKATEKIINEEKLKLMKKTAILVNISRGAVVDQDALVRALKNKSIRGAALDVMTPEPLPPDHELLTLDNCILTPHIGSADVVTRTKMAEMVSKNIVAGLSGRPLPAEV